MKPPYVALQSGIADSKAASGTGFAALAGEEAAAKSA